MNDLHCAIPRQVHSTVFGRGLFLFDNVAPKRTLRREVHHAYAATA
jgi:hypothetical protein